MDSRVFELLVLALKEDVRLNTLEGRVHIQGCFAEPSPKVLNLQQERLHLSVLNKRVLTPKMYTLNSTIALTRPGAGI